MLTHVLRGALALAGILLLIVGVKSGNTMLKGTSFLFIFGSMFGPKISTSLVAHLSDPAVKYRWRVRWFMVVYFLKEYGPRILWYVFDKGKALLSFLWRITKAYGPTILSALWKFVVFVWGGVYFLARNLPAWSVMMIAGVGVFTLAVYFRDFLGVWALFVGFTGMMIFAGGVKMALTNPKKQIEKLASLIISKIKERARG